MAEPDQHLSDEELISAYCDGELRGPELARAEELVANRPECRQLFEEYRALRARLREVPQRTLGGDFSQRVLRRAERDMLVTAAPAESYAYAASAPAQKTVRWPQGRRPWIYAAAAVAAAVIVMLVESKDLTREPARQLARHEPLPRDTELSAPRSSDASSFEAHRKAETAASAAVDGTARSAAPASAPGQVAANKAPTSPSPGAAASKDGRAPTLPDDVAVPDDVDVKRVLDELGWPAISEQVARQAATVEQQQGGQVLPLDVLVVECNIAPQNRTPDPMMASFASNSIAVDSTVPKAKEPAAKAADRKAAALGEAADKDNRLEPVEVFFVVATPDQLEATLTDLGNRPGVSYKLLTENRLNQAGIGNQAGRAGESQRPTADAEREKKPANADQVKPEPAGGQSQSLGKIASQQGRAQRLDIPENLRRLSKSSPSAGQQNKPAATNSRVADQVQPAITPAAPSKRGLNEQSKSSAAPAPPTTALEQVPYQRALFIVRVRPAEK